jgi:UDP-glucose/iron transport system ATP-binding protein
MRPGAATAVYNTAPMPRLAVHAVTFAVGPLTQGPYDLTVEAGTCVGLAGPSGIGKTLFLKAVADLLPHAGDVRLDGVGHHEVAAPVWRRRVALMPAAPVWWHDTVRPHFPADPFPAGVTPADLGLAGDVLAWDVARLSAGERQRLALLRTLAREPACLLLDEPTAHLDARAARRVEAAVGRYMEKRGAPVLWVAHDAAALMRVAGRVVTLTPAGLVDGLVDLPPEEPK